jgi:putative ATP-dependent endonuclease of OLD family
LTIIAIEEPENSLAPFYLSRIVTQIKDVTSRARAQAIVASHSSSILARVEPEQIRHFRLNRATGTAHIRRIRLPTDVEEASKYIREAVRTYPELYFASFVVLGEGATEEIVIPRLAEAMKVPIDRSFVAVVPLGGRHVKYLWRLLNDIGVPYATLLDLDVGRSGGGWGRIKSICLELIANDVKASLLVPDSGRNSRSETESLELITKLDQMPLDHEALEMWRKKLQEFGVYFCSPLDLDMSMLTAFEEEYQNLGPSQRGPLNIGNVALAVLGDEGDTEAYDASWDDRFRWYRYLFLGRGKPTTHVRVLANADNHRLARNAPPELRALIAYVYQQIYGPPLGQPTTGRAS